MLRFYTMATHVAKPSRMAAWLVHAYTSTGAVLAFIGAWAVVHGDDRLALGSMFLATIVDATDGVLARRVRVKEILPEVSTTTRTLPESPNAQATNVAKAVPTRMSLFDRGAPPGRSNVTWIAAVS